MLFLHKKTGNLYRRLGKAIDVGRGRYGVLVVIYARKDAEPLQLFVRQIDEFTGKFERHVTQDNVQFTGFLTDGPRYRHLSSGHVYRELGRAIDATNCRDGMSVIIYCRDQEPGEIYVAPTTEFADKFEHVA